MRVKISTVISVAGVVVLFIVAWNAPKDETPHWNPPPTPEVVVNWCQPVAVPLYDNGTDCQ